MKGKSEIRFCALGILCLVVIAAAAVGLSEATREIRLAERVSAEGTPQTEMLCVVYNWE